MLILLTVLLVSHQQPAFGQASNVCQSKLKCGDCIRTPGCGWCPQEDLKQRCNLVEMFNCTIGWYNPKTEATFRNEKSQPQRMISPQRIDLKLRINEKYRVNISFVQPGNRPVDLYYLMDLSNSMADDKTRLSGLGVGVHDAMKNITKDFRMGFGSFDDKVLMPYVSMTPQTLKVPCENCIPPYGFRNHMKLSSSSETFSEMVNNSQVSGNLDLPEGGFDALLQAIVCGDEIGWRNESLRLVLYTTDAPFHHAGDGKLGGVIKPNDGLCHLDEQGSYTESSNQDFPSIAQINRLAQDHKINIIFAVTEDQLIIYDKLKGFVKNSVSATLANNSANVIDLITEQYENIRSKVELQHNAPGHISLEYYSKCLGATPERTAHCMKLKTGDVVTFEVEFSVSKCPSNPDEWRSVVHIHPAGFDESVAVHVDLLCQCACEQEKRVLSSKCGNQGAFQCGMCSCDENFLGANCECAVNNGTTDALSTDGCFDENLIMCNNRGECSCGACQCDKRPNSLDTYSGMHCECDDFSCPATDGELCSGNGNCDCGRCQCDSKFKGNACECPISNEACLAADGTICSGKGECVCGKCECQHTPDGQYSGKLCEQCLTCPGRCDDLNDCVLCRTYAKGRWESSADACAGNCSHMVLLDERPMVNIEHDCTYYYGDSCKYNFVYREGRTNGEVEVFAQSYMDCSEPLQMLVTVATVIAAIIILGIILVLLWKVITTLHDRFEFSRFEEERQLAMWNQNDNPLFKDPTSKFMNPMYTG